MKKLEEMHAEMRRGFAAWQEAAAATRARDAGRPAQRSSGVTVPFGSSKGKPIEGESDKSILWLINYAREAVSNPDKARFADSNQALLDACLAEGVKRGIVQDEPPPPSDDDAPQGDVPF